MAVTQQDYYDGIGRAALVWSDAVLENIKQEKSGCQPSWEKLFCQFKQIECAEYFLYLGDYAVSADSITYYRYMLDIAGGQYTDATLDPFVQLPGTGIVIEVAGPQAIDLAYTEVNLLDSGGGNWYLPLIDKATGNALPFNYRPVLLVVNGTSFTPTFDNNFSPTRLYGFSSNVGPQTIIVTIVIT